MKRIALISDVHGNAVALEAVLDDLAGRGVDELVCMEDVAAGGPQPREALARLRELGCPVVVGNADGWLLEGVPREPERNESEIDRLAAIVEWARARLSSADREFLPLRARRRARARRHNPPRLPRLAALSVRTHPRGNAAGKARGDARRPPRMVYAGGHTHLQLLRRLGEALYLNPGSAGLPPATDPSLPFHASPTTQNIPAHLLTASKRD